MSDEKIINYAIGKNNLSSNALDELKSFLKKDKQKIDFEKLIKIKKPLSEEEIIRKNEFKKQINSLSKDYNLPSELICTSKNLVKFIRGDSSVSINRGWRAKIFKI